MRPRTPEHEPSASLFLDPGYGSEKHELELGTTSFGIVSTPEGERRIVGLDAFRPRHRGGGRPGSRRSRPTRRRKQRRYGSSGAARAACVATRGEGQRHLHGVPCLRRAARLPRLRRALRDADRAAPAGLRRRSRVEARGQRGAAEAEEASRRARGPAAAASAAPRGLAQAPIEAIDELGHPLEPLGDHTNAVLEEVLGLHAERFGEPLHHLVRRDRAVAVDEVVEVSRRQPALRAQAPERHAGLGHEALEGRPEGLLAVLAPARHYDPTPASSSMGTRLSPPFARTSTVPSSRVFLPTTTRSGAPIRSASANFSPARRWRSSRSTARPPTSSASAVRADCSSSPGSTTTCTSYGAIAAGHVMPFSSS